MGGMISARAGLRETRWWPVLLLALAPAAAAQALVAPAQSPLPSTSTGRTIDVQCVSRTVGHAEVTLDIPAFSCTFMAAPGTAVRFEFTPDGHACAAAAADPLTVAESAARSIVERIRNGTPLSGNEDQALRAVFDVPGFTLESAISSVNFLLAGSSSTAFAIRTSAQRIPRELPAPAERRAVVPMQGDAVLRWWCINETRLRQIWLALAAVAIYRADMARYRDTWPAR